MDIVSPLRTLYYKYGVCLNVHMLLLIGIGPKCLSPYIQEHREFNLIRAAEGKREKYLSMHFERELEDAFRCAAVR